MLQPPLLPKLKKIIKKKKCVKMENEKFREIDVNLYSYLMHSLISSQKNPSPVKPEGHGAHLKFHGKKNS